MPPRRTSFGHQNVVYSDAEQTVIKNRLKTTKAILLRLNTLRNNARQHQLKDQIHRCKVALAPFKKIPREIWIYIFELCCQSAWLGTCSTTKSPVVLISQVCSVWRQIVLSMPKLWSDVHLTQSVDLARLWLGRAGNIPRGLKTSAYRYFNRPLSIQTCSFPFRKLHLTQSDAAGINFRAIPVESLLRLEDLALLKSPDFPDLGAISLSPHHFPNLVSLRIDSKAMPHFHVSRPFATWKKLRVLWLRCELDNVDYREILRDASSVEDCGLYLSLMSQDPPIETAVFANLKILRLSFSPFTPTLLSFLDHFTFPNLHQIVLMPDDNFQPWNKLSLLRLAPCIGSLRSLNFHHSSMNVDLGLVLECLPLLRALELHCREITTDTAEKIGRGELGGCLRELRDWRSSNLLKLLRACELRWQVTEGQSTNSSGAIARLEKVSVRCTLYTLTCKQRIRKLCENGVQFEVFKVPVECD